MTAALTPLTLLLLLLRCNVRALECAPRADALLLSGTAWPQGSRGGGEVVARRKGSCTVRRIVVLPLRPPARPFPALPESVGARIEHERHARPLRFPATRAAPLGASCSPRSAAPSSCCVGAGVLRLRFRRV